MARAALPQGLVPAAGAYLAGTERFARTWGVPTEHRESLAALFSGSAEDKEASVASAGEGEATRAATSDAAGSSQKSSAAGIEAVLEYRVFKGNEQWRVRWEEQAESWEMWPVLDTDALRNHAEALRQSSA